MIFRMDREFFDGFLFQTKPWSDWACCKGLKAKVAGKEVLNVTGQCPFDRQEIVWGR